MKSIKKIYLIILAVIISLPGTAVSRQKYYIATLAGGCFWSMQTAFDNVKGVTKVWAGYTGGKGSEPTYKNYSGKGFIEAIQITYDPAVISFNDLLDIYWQHINPTDPGGQFYDRGPNYRIIIFYHDNTQKKTAEASKSHVNKTGIFDKPVVTEIMKSFPFYKAEKYHQDYAKKYPEAYYRYKVGSGREAYFSKIWGNGENILKLKNRTSPAKQSKRGEAELKKKLTPMQYNVTQEDGTEPPFQNEYWNNKKEGIYVDIVSGEALFSSTDKYDSGTGWPSFTKPLVPENIKTKTDRSLFMVRTEVRSVHADSHLGHVFNDGPAPTGLRYCMNSAALKFIQKADLEKEGYGGFLYLFNK